MTVNYGAPIIWREALSLSGRMVRAEHDGPDGHEQLQPGEQCACGRLGLGIIRKKPS